MKMSDVIAGNPYLLLLMEHLGIGLGIQEKTIDAICAENGIDTGLFLFIANLYAGNQPREKVEYSSGIVVTIIRYLRNSHKYYLEDKYPLIKSCIDEINSVNNSSETRMIGKFFDKYFIEVKEHLDYENNTVFPYVTSLDDILSGKKTNTNPDTYRVNEYRVHHDDIEEKLEDLNNLLVKYLPQKKEGNVRRKLLFYLYELEYDLAIHSQVEESLLIPIVEKMETLRNNSPE